jgi:fatty acid desaturase
MSLTDIHAPTHAPAEGEAATVLKILLSVAVFVAGWATSVVLWGIPGLYIPALILVPVVWALLLIISRG